MTITNTSIKAVAQGNSATTVWPYTFLIPNQASLIVSLVDVASGNITIVAPANYSVTGLGNPNGGSVTYPLSGSPLTNATQIVIQRAVADVQNTSFANQSAVYPADIENALDYITMITQQLADTQSRSIVFSIADTIPTVLPSASARAGKYLGFDISGNPIATPGPLAGVAVSAAMTPVVQAPTTAAALTLLGIPGSLLDLLIPSGTEWNYDAGGTAPAGFVFPIGQPCTPTYPDYRAKLIAAGSPYGTNGVDPLMPDRRGSVGVGKSNMGGVDNGLLPGGTVLGAVLGNSLPVNLAVNQIPSLTSVNAAQNITVSTNFGDVIRGSLLSSGAAGGANQQLNAAATGSIVASSGSNSISVTYTNGSQQGVSRLQLSFVCNVILKVH